jgi:hypothetical protein
MTSESSVALPRGLIPTDARLLPWALKLDAVVTGANGVAYLALAGPLGDLLGMPTSGLRAIGAFLAVFALAVWLVAARPAPPAVAAVVAANAAWAVGSLAFFAADAWTPSTAGAVWTVLQAAVVGLFAALQVKGLRRARG